MKLGMSNVAITRPRVALRPIFEAPLTCSLRAIGSGSTTPTSSRASTAYVRDHESVERLALAGEARFWGARRVQNYYLRSQDMAHAAWTNVAMTVTAGDADPFGGTQAQRLTGNGVATPHQVTQFVGGTAVGNTFTMSRYLKAFDGTRALIFLLDGASVQGVQMQVDLTTGTITAGPSPAGAATNAQGAIKPVSGAPGWYRVWVSCTFGAGAVANPNAGVALGDGSAVNLSDAQGIVCYGNQLENVTGQSVVTPSEYVSTNVLSIPFHGANVDGVRYFDTVRLNTQNRLLQSNNFLATWGTAGTATVALSAAGGAPGGYDAFSLTDDAGNTSHRVSQSVIVANAPGRNFTFDILLKNVTKGTALVVVTDQNFSSRAQLRITDLGAGVFSSSMTGSMLGSVSLTNAGDGWWLARVTANFQFDPVTNIHALVYMSDNASLAAYVGSGQSILVARGALRSVSPSITNDYAGTTTAQATVDTGTTAPIPETTLFGYFRELSRTQLIATTAALRDWTNAAWTLGATMTRSFGTITGVDAVPNTATRLTAGATSATNYIESVLAAAASTRTFSCYIRRVTGTGPVRLYQGGVAGTSVNWASSLVVGQWVRCYIFANVDVTTLGFGVQVDTSGDVIDVDFAQFEASSANDPIGSTFIPTGGVARAQDTLSFPTAGNISDTEGTAYVEAISPLGPMVNVANAFHSTNNEVICINAFGAQAYIRDSLGTVISTGGAGAPVNAIRKFATSWKLGGNKSAVSTGSTLATNAFSGSRGTGLNIAIGINGAGSISFIGCLRNLRIFAKADADPILNARVN